MELTGQIGGKRAREKQRTSYLVSLSEWMTNQVLGKMTKRQKFNVIKSSRGQEIMAIHDHQRPEWTWHIEEDFKQDLDDTSYLI